MWKFNPTTGVGTNYIYLAGKLVAMSEGAAGAPKQVTYYYTDLQGSTLGTTNTAGQFINTADRKPYGGYFIGRGVGDVGFVGNIQDDESGLDYFRARYYDADVGRFVSVDPVAVRPSDITNFNRFAYAANNPIANNDHNGRDCTTANGMTRCVTATYDVSFNAQAGFKDFTSSSENYHYYSVPVLAMSVEVSNARAQLVASPTPGFSNGASANGTANDATPVIGGIYPKELSPVTSFTVTNMVDHQPAVVNVTREGHPLSSGIVVREAVSTPLGGSLIQTWGEGTSELQAPSSMTGPIINSIWNFEGPIDFNNSPCGFFGSGSCM